MSAILAKILLVFITTILLSLFYWQIVRPVFMLAIRYKLFALRDELRSMAISQTESLESFSYQNMEWLINKSIHLIPSTSLAKFIIYMARSKAKSESSERFEKEGSAALKSIRNRVVSLTICGLSVNSPLVVIGAFIMASVLWVSGKINKYILIKRTENFVSGLTDGRLAPA